MRTPFKIALAVTVLLFLAVIFLLETIPPRSLTSGRMWVTKRRIIQIARQNNQLPSTLAELPPMPGYDTEIIDAWKRPLYYDFDSLGVVTLRSLGADGRLGGEGDNRDMTGVFETRDARGHWQDEFSKWKHDPFEP